MTPSGVVARLTDLWWQSLDELKAEVAAAGDDVSGLAVAFAGERARADELLKALEGVSSMTPREASGLLNLVLVLFANEGRDDDQIYRLLTVMRDSLAPKN